MDIVLERMLSLIPRKPDGKYVHGGKKEFCDKIGAPTNIISEWESGKTKSYRNYVYIVAAEYGVSVEWLKGETDEKSATVEPAAQNDPVMEELYSIIKKMSEAEKMHLLEKARQIIEI